MKILLYGVNFHPEPTGVGKYSGEMAAWLAEAGHEVRVVTAPPHFPDWRIARGYSGAAYRRERWRGMDVLRAPIWMPRRRGGVLRLLAMGSFALSSMPALVRQVRWRPDVVWMAAPALVCAPGTLAIASLTGARSFLHVQDFEVDAAFELGLLRGAVWRRAANWFERRLLSAFDRVSTISPNMAARLREKGVAAGRLVNLPNWVDTSEVFPLPRPSNYRAELNLPDDATVVLYSGSIGAKQGIEVLADAARLLVGDPAIRFVFCGQGLGLGELRDRCQGLANVTLLPLQPVERLNELLNLADIHVLPQRRGAADLVLPSKLLGMLASGRPVVATAEAGSALAAFVDGRGLVVAPESPQALADAVAQLKADASTRHALGLAGRRYAELHLGRDAVLTLFEGELRLACGL